MKLRWPWSGKPKPQQFWYDEPDYLRLPADKSVSIATDRLELGLTAIVKIDKTQITIYLNKGTYLNRRLVTIDLDALQ